MQPVQNDRSDPLNRYVGWALVLATVLLAGAIFYHARAGRYQLHTSDTSTHLYILDSFTGELTIRVAPSTVSENPLD